MIRHGLASALILLSLACSAVAQSVRIGAPDEIQPLLNGLVDFEGTSASVFPGTMYRSNDLPFLGLRAGTYLAGQVPIKRKAGRQAFGAIWGLPATPVEIGKVKSISYLNLVEVGTGEQKRILLSSHIHDGAFPSSHTLQAGYGQIAIRFTNPQRAIGILIDTLVERNNPEPFCFVRFFDSDGHELPAPNEARGPQYRVYVTEDMSRQIRAITIENFGPVGIGVDEIRFEAPQILSSAGFRLPMNAHRVDIAQLDQSAKGVR